MHGDVRSGMQGREIGNVKMGTWGREIGGACYIAEKQKQMSLNTSEKLISSNKAAQTSAVFLSICIDLPITNTFLS